MVVVAVTVSSALVVTTIVNVSADESGDGDAAGEVALWWRDFFPLRFVGGWLSGGGTGATAAEGDAEWADEAEKAVAEAPPPDDDVAAASLGKGVAGPADGLFDTDDEADVACATTNKRERES